MTEILYKPTFLKFHICTELVQCQAYSFSCVLTVSRYVIDTSYDFYRQKFRNTNTDVKET